MSKASIFVAAGWAGGAALVISLAGEALAFPTAITLPAAVICFVACWILLSTRNADEYTQGLWASAASLAFAAMLVMMIVSPFLEGFYAGITGKEDGEPSLRAIFAWSIAAFYAGLFWKKFREV